jgi:hypothetical protein
VHIHRSVIGAVAVATLLGLTGCPAEEKPHAKEETKATAAPQPTAPAPTPAPTAAPTAADTAAAALDTKPLPAPPADQVETMGKAPSTHHTWVNGYWHWGGHEYAWHPGYWEDETSFATAAPPPLRVERPYVSPGAGYFFAPGYWHWSGKEYAWAPGHWTVKREGFAYVHPTYREEKGHWVRAGLGWEKENDAWKKRYATGWDHHGEVWVHHDAAAEFVKRGEREGWAHHK